MLIKKNSKFIRFKRVTLKCYITWDDNRHSKKNATRHIHTKKGRSENIIWYFRCNVTVIIIIYICIYFKLLFIYFNLNIVSLPDSWREEAPFSPWIRCWRACLRRISRLPARNPEFRATWADSCLPSRLPWKRFSNVPSRIASDVELCRSLPMFRFLEIKKKKKK